MKVIGIVGSPRKGGNTEILTAHTLKAIAEEGLETELIPLAGLDIKPCNACGECAQEERCPIEDDLFPIYVKMREADGIILASPVYYSSATALIKALMERVPGTLPIRVGRLSRIRWGVLWWLLAARDRTSLWHSLLFGFRYSIWWCPVRPIGTWHSAGKRARYPRMKRG